MNEENELEQIRLRKIQAMLDAAKKDQTTVSKQPIILTDSNFSGAVSANELLVVDFWAPWCGPCRMVGPIIEALSAEYTGKTAFGKMNVDENQEVPSSFGIMSIPTIIIFNHGKEVERLVGAYPKAHIEAMIKRYLG
jgi:thioredoxin